MVPEFSVSGLSKKESEEQIQTDIEMGLFSFETTGRLGIVANRSASERGRNWKKTEFRRRRTSHLAARITHHALRVAESKS
jgi:hypothetical protein